MTTGFERRMNHLNLRLDQHMRRRDVALDAKNFDEAHRHFRAAARLARKCLAARAKAGLRGEDLKGVILVGEEPQ